MNMIKKKEDLGDINFIKLPKALFTNKRYDEMRIEGKVLYGILLNLISLSMENNMKNKCGEPYVKLSRKKIMTMLNIKGSNKVAAVMKELKDLGLISEKFCGLNKCNEIYLYKVEDTKPINHKESNEEKSIKREEANIEKKNLKEDSSLKNKERATINRDVKSTLQGGVVENKANKRKEKDTLKKDKNTMDKFSRRNINGERNNHKSGEENPKKHIKTNYEIEDKKKSDSIDSKALKGQGIKNKFSKNPYDLETNHKESFKEEINSQEQSKKSFKDCENKLYIKTNTKKTYFNKSSYKKEDHKGESSLKSDIKLLKELYKFYTLSDDEAKLILKMAKGNIYIADLAYEKTVERIDKVENFIGYNITLIKSML